MQLEKNPNNVENDELEILYKTAHKQGGKQQVPRKK